MAAFKVVILGQSGVGKSSLALRLCRDEFYDAQETTIGAGFLTHTLQLDDGTPVRLEIWDTAGQERYRSLAPMYYRGAAAAVVVYAVTDRESFEGAKSWVREVQKRGDPACTIALVGNKADLAAAGGGAARRVPADEGAAVAAEMGLLFFEASARAGGPGGGVAAVFRALARAVLPKLASREEAAAARDSGVVALDAARGAAPPRGARPAAARACC